MRFTTESAIVVFMLLGLIKLFTDEEIVARFGMLWGIGLDFDMCLLDSLHLEFADWDSLYSVVGLGPLHNFLGLDRLHLDVYLLSTVPESDRLLLGVGSGLVHDDLAMHDLEGDDNLCSSEVAEQYCWSP